MGGTGLEPVTPSLSIWGRRSRQFGCVRSERMVERNPPTHRTLERTRTNTEPAILATLGSRGEPVLHLETQRRFPER